LHRGRPRDGNRLRSHRSRVVRGEAGPGEAAERGFVTGRDHRPGNLGAGFTSGAFHRVPDQGRGDAPPAEGRVDLEIEQVRTRHHRAIELRRRQAAEQHADDPFRVRR
jgi:hypothetical protein